MSTQKNATLQADGTVLAELLRGEGIEHWAVVNADLGEDRRARAQEYRQWIAEGRHGTMHFLEAHEAMKYDPSAILAGTQSVIVVALSYFRGRSAGTSAKNPNTGRISSYAQGRDYHRELGGRLRRIARTLSSAFPQNAFRPFTDTAPLHERIFAERAGLSFTGKNTLSLNSTLGSYFFLGEILSTRYFAPCRTENEAGNHCPRSCTRCIRVCPTGALESPYRIHAGKCISYLTIEHKGSIAPELRRSMGRWIFGCDLCQDVCPFNIRAEITPAENFQNALVASNEDLGQILRMRDHADFTAKFAGTPVMRAGRVSMVRNALIAAANGACIELIPIISRLQKDSNEVIAETAAWSLAELREKQIQEKQVREKGSGEAEAKLQ